MSYDIHNVYVGSVQTLSGQAVDDTYAAMGEVDSQPDLSCVPKPFCLSSPQIPDLSLQNVPTSELEDNDWIDSFLNEHSHVDNYTADTIPVLPHIDFQTTFPLLLSPEEAQSQERKMYFIKTEGDRKSSTQAGGTSTQGDQKGLGFQLQLIDLKTLTGNCSQQPQPVTASDHGLVANKTDQAESQKEEVLDDASLSSELSSCTDGIPLMDSRNQISAQVDPKLITIDDLRQLFDYPMGEASLKLGIGPTTMKKICRKHGVKRWPYRHRQSLLKMKAKVMQDNGELKGGVANKEVLQMIDEQISKSQPSIALKKIRQAVFKKEHKERNNHRF